MKINSLAKPILIFFFGFVFSQGIAQSDCKLRKDQDSIKVYTCHTDSSKFKSILAEFSIRTTFDELEAFVLDAANYKTWQYKTVVSRFLSKVSASEVVYYTVVEAPWPVSNRDMVVRLSIQRTAELMTISANSERGIMPDKKDFIRVPSSHSIWLVTKISATRLQVTYRMQIDPGGTVPVWLVNLVCAQAPYLSFKNLKEHLEKRN